jgi:hypothetical protein
VSRDLIKSEGASAKDIAPKVLSESGVQDDCPERFKDGLIKPLRKNILLRSVSIREFLAYDMFGAVVAKFDVGKLSTSVRVKNGGMIANLLGFYIQKASESFEYISF